MSKRNGDTPSYRVTSAGVNPNEDRAHRMRMYFIAMTLRLACVLSLFWVSGWWLVFPIVGAVALPWFAVMVGNAVAHGGEQQVEVPDPLELEPSEPAEADSSSQQAPDLLVVDVEPVRRSSSQQTPGHANSGGDPEARSGSGGAATRSATTGSATTGSVTTGHATNGSATTGHATNGSATIGNDREDSK